MSGHALSFTETLFALFFMMNFRFKQNISRYIVTWVMNFTAYFVFTTFCLNSDLGFLWWLDKTKVGFAAINIIFALKEAILLILTWIESKYSSEIKGFTKLLCNDIIMHGNNLVFWSVSVVYVFVTQVTAERLKDQDWIDSIASLNKFIFLVPVFKLIIDVLNFFSNLFFVMYRPNIQESMTKGMSILFLDLQYLFVYLFISGKVTSDFYNLFIVFVWIYMALIVHCILGLFLIFNSIRKGLELTDFGVFLVMFSMGLSFILLFVWATLVGVSNGNPPDSSYLLVVCLICYLCFHIKTTQGFIKKGSHPFE